MQRERRLTKGETPEAPTKKLSINDTSIVGSLVPLAVR